MRLHVVRLSFPFRNRPTVSRGFIGSAPKHSTQFSQLQSSSQSLQAKRVDSRRVAQVTAAHLRSRPISSATASQGKSGGFSSELDPTPTVISQISDITSHGGKFGIVTVSNATKLNLVNSEILVQLRDTLAALCSNSDLRAVILTGATTPGKSPAFIGGADIQEMAAINNPEEARDFITKIHEVCEAIRNVPVPVIGRIHGFSLGAGMEIAAACDLRVATKASMFGMPEVRVGIPSVVEARLLPDLIGWSRTRKFLYLAENINAERALQWGLIDKMTESVEELDTAIDTWVGLIAQNGPEAMKSQKRLIKAWETCNVDEGIKKGIDAFAESWKDGGQEPKAMMGRFLNRKR